MSKIINDRICRSISALFGKEYFVFLGHRVYKGFVAGYRRTHDDSWEVRAIIGLKQPVGWKLLDEFDIILRPAVSYRTVPYSSIFDYEIQKELKYQYEFQQSYDNDNY